MVTDDPRTTEREPPFESEKSNVEDTGFTVRLKLVLLESDPAIPDTTNEYVPVGVVALVVTVSVEEHVGVQLGGEKLALAPTGRPVMENATDAAVPETRDAETEFVTEDPGVTERAPPFESEKSNAGGVPPPE